MTTHISHWIDGALTPGSGPLSPVFNPATGEHTGDVELATPAEIEQAITSAKLAAVEWRSASLSRRSGILFRFRELLSEHADELAAEVTSEHGKVLSDAGGEVARGLEKVEYA